MGKYYSSREIRALGCRWNWVIGKRSNGKSFDFFYNGVKDYVETGAQFAWLRRYNEDFVKKRGEQMFSALECDGDGVNRIMELTGEKYNEIYYNSRRWYLSRYDPQLDKHVHDPTPFAYGFALTSMEHDKGTSYPGVKTIIFDEALTRDSYLDDEFVLLTNCISTIVRNREDVTIFLLGNTVNPYCPHFEEMGLRHIKEQAPGTIQIYNVGEDNRVRIAVEYCADNTKSSKATKNELFAFDNPHLKMITTGSWEMDIYPHCPEPFTRDDIILSFFIIFTIDTLQADIVSTVNGNLFIFIHRKTTPIRHPDTDLIYQQDYDPRPNFRRKLTSPVLPIEGKIWQLFKADKVFYQSNEVGEIVRNYLQWCTT